MKKALLIIIILLGIQFKVSAQGSAGDKLGPAYQAYIDSIKARPYRYVFPVWGKRLAKKGFDLPLPAGIMLNPYFGSQEVKVTDLQVGFNSSELVPLDFVKFGKVKASIQSVTVRPDVWILPFVDLYGIAGTTWSQTSVELTAPVNMSTSANFFGYTCGLGTTIAAGMHGFVTIIDLNHTWSFIDEIKGSIQATMFTPRLGHNFRFKNRPDQSVTVWVGAPGIFINRTTEGTIDISSLTSNVDKNALQGIIDETQQWYQDLSPVQKKLVKSIAQSMKNKLDGLPDNLSVSYSLVKNPVSHWSMCVGGQFQMNHRWQMRAEAGFLGGRESLLLSGNYRFGF